MKKEVSVRDGMKQFPIRPVYMVPVEHERKKNITSIGMFEDCACPSLGQKT